MAELICGCASNSPGDSGNPDEPEVIVHIYINFIVTEWVVWANQWFQNHMFTERKLLGEAGSSRKREDGGSQSSGSSIHADDTEAMEEHIRELQKEGRRTRISWSVSNLIAMFSGSKRCIGLQGVPFLQESSTCDVNYAPIIIKNTCSDASMYYYHVHMCSYAGYVSCH